MHVWSVFSGCSLHVLTHHSLRQFQECGGWIRVKLHTRLYTCHPPPHPTHTHKKNTTTTTLPKNHLFFFGGGKFASHELSCYLLLQEWLEKNAEEVKQVARAAYNRIPDKSTWFTQEGQWRPLPPFSINDNIKTWWICHGIYDLSFGEERYSDILKMISIITSC